LSQNRRFRGAAIFDEKGCQNGFKNDGKINLGALGGTIYEILGDLLRGQIFDRFSIEKKSSENQ